MTYKIIGDSCLDLTEDMKKDPRFQMIPLTLQVGSAQVVDDETFDQKRFIEMVKACPECPKTACPSPETFKAAFEEAEAEAVFVITLSSHLSGSYNSAELARKLFEEERAEKGMAEQAKKVAVIDSLSASSGELNIALFIQNLCDSGLEFDEVVEKTLAYRDGMNTYFVLESLDNLRKNGRLSAVKALVATALNIKPVMGATDQGVITQLGQARGMQKALRLMAETIAAELEHPEEKVLGLVHCNNPERAEYVKQELLKLVNVKDIIVLESSGVSTLYASQGGIIIAV